MSYVSYLLMYSFLLSMITSTLSDYKNLDFVKSYEFAEIKINFETKYGAEAIRIRNSVSMELRAYGKSFQIFLQEDNSITSPFTKVTILGEETSEIDLRNIPDASIYEGIVEGIQQSTVNGYINQDGFVGRMDLKDEVYYLEMASKYIHKEEYEDKVIIYKQKDLLPLKNEKWHSDEVIFNHKIFERKLKENSVNHSEFLQKEKLKLKTKLTCKITLLVDHTMVEHMQGNRARIIAEMLYHLKVADKIFSNLDLDNDLTPEGFGFIMENIILVENKYSQKYHLNKNFSRIITMMKEIENNYKQEQCLFIVFCHRDFNGAVGIANTGGICFGSKYKHIPSENIVLLTSKILNLTVSTIKISYTLIHELGHSFGSPHDKINNTVCSPGKTNPNLGQYIMYPYVQSNLSDGSRVNNWIFSPCSINRIKAYIELIQYYTYYCLTSSRSKCGNGITEFGEECDCGPVGICNELDPCCNPPGSSKECTLKRQTRRFCSPREGACCTQICSIVPKTENRKCYIFNNPCYNNTGICNGKSAFCSGIPLSDGTSCMRHLKSCQFGHCISNICEERGLTPCECGIQYECQVCCIFNGKCQTTSQLNLRPPSGSIYKRIPGTRCNNDKGLCLRNGECSSSSRRQRESADIPLFTDKRWNNWRYYPVIPLILIAALIITFFVFKRYFIRNKENI